jgi:tRNA threonylcarbamoyl adenosine modification protein YeaZ
MIVLGVDTSSSVVAVCLRRNAQHWVRAGTARSANELVAALTDAVLVDAGVSLADVKRVGLAIGPGSFTGLRIGLAFCKGLSFGLRVPIYPIGSFEAAAEVALAASAQSACGVIAVTGKERYAAAVYDEGSSCRWIGELTGDRTAVVAKLRQMTRAEIQVIDLSGGAKRDNDLGVIEVGAELSVSVANRTFASEERSFDIQELASIQPIYGRETAFRTLASRGLVVGE